MDVMRLLTLPTVPSHACAARLLSSLLSSEKSRLVATDDALCHTMLRPDANLAPWLLPPRSVTIEYGFCSWTDFGRIIPRLASQFKHKVQELDCSLPAAFPPDSSVCVQRPQERNAMVGAAVDNTLSATNGMLSEVRASPISHRLRNTPRLILNGQTLLQSRRSLSVEPSQSRSGESHL